MGTADKFERRKLVAEALDCGDRVRCGICSERDGHAYSPFAVVASVAVLVSVARFAQCRRSDAAGAILT